MPVAGVLVLLLKATVLLLTGLVLLRFTSRFSPAVRHMVCLATIGGSLAVLATAFLPDSAVILDVPASVEFLPAAQAGPVGLSLAEWVATIWVCGCALMLLRLPVGCAVLWRVRLTAVSLESLSGVSTGAFVFLADVNVPLLTGYIRPIILLPRVAVNWPQSRLDAAIRHEFAHLSRHDLSSNLVAAVACAVYWFHPLVWIVTRRMSAEQESACDDLVLQSGLDRADYAEALLQTASHANSGFLTSCPMTNQSGVKARVVRILSTAANSPAPSVFGRMPMAVFAGLVFAFVTAGSLGAERVYSVGGDVTGPAVIRQIEPRHTDAARRAKLQGTVHLKLVVDSNGVARDIVVTQGIDSGLEANTLQALRQWRFRPATRNARPVAVRANIDVNFRLR